MAKINTEGSRKVDVDDDGIASSPTNAPMTPTPHNQQQQSGLDLKLIRTPDSAVKKHLRPFQTTEIKVLLLEGVNQIAIDAFKREGYQVESMQHALSEEDLTRRLREGGIHAIGIRSKSQLTADVLRAAKDLLVVGCFCIGTNQVDLECAAEKGVPVFNSPFSNSRSVAEMTISNIIALARQIGDRNREMHEGNWNKQSRGCFEIRGKKLGIVGYGHIGSQLSVLAESMGMNVLFFDILQIMPLGCATPKESLLELLKEADFVTLHVPATPDTKNMIGAEELAAMKPGAYLINASRGNVVAIPALVQALKSGHLAGAAIDVYPKEPASNGKGKFESELMGCPNTILSPHIGGSTEEAQSAIGVEVSNNLIKYLNNGSFMGSVNFPEVDLRVPPASSQIKFARVVNIHHNVPGVLKQLNQILAIANIDKQICDSKGPVACVVADISTDREDDLREIYSRMVSMGENIKTRILY